MKRVLSVLAGVTLLSVGLPGAAAARPEPTPEAIVYRVGTVRPGPTEGTEKYPDKTLLMPITYRCWNTPHSGPVGHQPGVKNVGRVWLSQEGTSSYTVGWRGVGYWRWEPVCTGRRHTEVVTLHRSGLYDGRPGYDLRDVPVKGTASVWITFIQFPDYGDTRPDMDAVRNTEFQRTVRIRGPRHPHHGVPTAPSAATGRP